MLLAATTRVKHSARRPSNVVAGRLSIVSGGMMVVLSCDMWWQRDDRVGRNVAWQTRGLGRVKAVVSGI